MAQQIGKYEILEKLGEGASSDVYRARDTQLGRVVALKVLKPALVPDSSSFGRFIQEAQAAAGLFHPNIATVLDMGEDGGRYFITMRYLPGQPLDKLLKAGGRQPWERVLHMARQVGAALDYAHKEGFLHRDVKPSNIICTPENDYILTDFGLVRAMMSTGLTSHTGAVLGTPAYIAPEIWLNETALPATDQYALACVVYEVLTGQVLFSGDTPPAIMTRHVLKGAELLEALPIEEGLPVQAALARALAKHPADRYPSLAAFTEALAQAARPVQAPVAPPPQPAPAKRQTAPLVSRQAAPAAQPLAQRPARQAEPSLAQAAPAPVPADPAPELDLERIDPQEAVRRLSEAIRTHPDRPELYRQRASAWMKGNDFKKARQDLDEAIRLQPDWSLAYHLRGVASQRLGNLGAALRDQSRALELNQDFWQAYVSRGSVSQRLGKHADACADFDEAIRLKPDLPEAYNGRGMAYLGLNDPGRAIEDFNQALKLQPGRADFYLHRAKAWRRKKEALLAGADEDKYLELVGWNKAGVGDAGDTLAVLLIFTGLGFLILLGVEIILIIPILPVTLGLITAGIGLWLRKEWARILGMIMVGLMFTGMIGVLIASLAFSLFS